MIEQKDQNSLGKLALDKLELGKLVVGIIEVGKLSCNRIIYINSQPKQSRLIKRGEYH